MKTLSKVLVGTVAAGAMASASVSPAYAAGSNGIGAGEIVAGAVVLGGIAAIAASADRNSADYGYRGDRYGYGRGDGPRQATDMCVRAAERAAHRYAGRANVTDVRNVDRKRDGYNVSGRIVVNDRSGWRRDRGYDSGRFTCKVRYGRVVDLDFKNIRGL